MKYLKTEPYFIQSLIHVANLQSVFVEEENGKKTELQITMVVQFSRRDESYSNEDGNGKQ